MRLGQPPIFQQIGAMLGGPFQNHRQRSPGQMSIPHGQRLDINDNRLPLIICMKVRRGMIIIIHADRNAEKHTNRRHIAASLPP